MSELYRLVYASKNLLQGSEAETLASITQILAASQRKNARSDVSGALMFNAGAFAQVLEGPRRQVEETFERIQCDDRHGEVTVLQCGPTEKRSFANWSMAFVGQSAGGQAQFSQLAAESGFDLSRLDGDAVFAMLHGLVLEEERVPAPAATAPPVEVPSATGLDVEQLRTEIARLRPEGAASRTPPAPDVVPTGPIAVVGPRAPPTGRGDGLGRRRHGRRLVRAQDRPGQRTAAHERTPDGDRRASGRAGLAPGSGRGPASGTGPVGRARTASCRGDGPGGGRRSEVLPSLGACWRTVRLTSSLSDFCRHPHRLILFRCI